MTLPTNHLAGETSPYLLQHAHNPVDWYPWSEAALDLAKAQDKPILLSIGYSACHWCHVMEHESFSDPRTAETMNRLFVNIKVDREERPDLDKIYQTAHQLMTGRPGGWPLTVVLTPEDHTPFFAGTYFPDTPRHGMPAFVQVLERIATYFKEHREKIAAHVTAMQQAFEKIETHPAAAPDSDILDRAVDELAKAFDPVHGGFGRAPKFPHPVNIELCLRKWAQDKAVGLDRPRYLHIARHTLANMARGGLYDQLGGGFYRYSVDEKWAIPHFEKMLYDNALLLPLYVDAWRATGDELFRDTAMQTAEWVMRDMQSPAGGFYSTLDADSEGVEGKFYVWSAEEIRAALTAEEYAVTRIHYGLDQSPNFEGKFHLNVAAGLENAAAGTGIAAQQAHSLLASARQKLLAIRERRTRPHRDEKTLTSWNALMIKAMARAGRGLQQPRFAEAAMTSLDFIASTLWRDDRLLATAKDDRAHLNAYLDDYVFLIDAILETAQWRWRRRDIAFAIRLADIVLDRFNDADAGGLFFTSRDHERLLHRPKPKTDDATPAGNGVGARVLLHLGHLLGEHRYLDAADGILSHCAASMNQAPSAHAALVIAAHEHANPGETIVLRGDPEACRSWLGEDNGYHPDRRLYTIPDEPGTALPGLLAERAPRGEVTAYICRGFSCSTPITDPDEFRDRIRQPKSS